jgi:hypothetical protein
MAGDLFAAVLDYATIRRSRSLSGSMNPILTRLTLEICAEDIMDNPGSLARASQLIRQGNTAEARELLAAMLQQNPRDGRIWALMSMAVTETTEKRHCLEQAVALSEHDDQTAEWAQQVLAALAPGEVALQHTAAAEPSQPIINVRIPPRLMGLIVLNVVLVGIAMFLFSSMIASRSLGTLFSKPTRTPFPVREPSHPAVAPVIPTADLDLTLTPRPAGGQVQLEGRDLLPLEDVLAFPDTWDTGEAGSDQVFSEPGSTIPNLRYALEVLRERPDTYAIDDTYARLQLLIFDDEATATQAYHDLALRAANNTQATETYEGTANAGEYRLFVNATVMDDVTRLGTTLTDYVYRQCKLVYAYDFVEYTLPGIDETKPIPMQVKMRLFKKTEKALADIAGCGS